MKNYFPTNEETRIKIIMLDLGFEVYPICTTIGIKNSPVYLAFSYRGVETLSSDKKGFSQRELTYRSIQLYKQLYNATINKQKK